MEEKKEVTHQFKFGSQIFWLVVGLTFFYFAIKKNPTKEDFVREVVKQYAKQEGGLAPATANLLASFAKELIGSDLNTAIERNDLLVFSTYKLEYSNEKFELRLSGTGFWENIFLDSTSYFRTLRPKVSFVNTTSDTIYLAVAFPDDKNKGQYISQGWYPVAPNESYEREIPLASDENGGFYYYGDNSTYSWSGGSKGVHFSVNHPDAFQYTFNKNPDESYTQESFRKLSKSSDAGWTKRVELSSSNADKKKAFNWGSSSNDEEQKNFSLDDL